MKMIHRFIEQLNFIQKTLLTIACSIVIYWLLDGFEGKLLEDILFKFINIVFSWSFDSRFGLDNRGYFNPDFIFIVCIVGLFIFHYHDNNDSLESEK